MSYMKSRDDFYPNDDFIHKLNENSSAFKQIKNNLKLIYIINKAILPCIIKFDLSYNMYYKITNITMYGSRQLSRKNLYFMGCRIPGFTANTENSGVEISNIPYDVIPNHSYTYSNINKDNIEQIREGDIKIKAKLAPYSCNSESRHNYLNCTIYFELHNKQLNEIFKLNKPVWLYVDCSNRPHDSSYANDQHNISNYFMKTISKYRNCKVVGYIEHADTTDTYNFKQLDMGLKNRSYICSDIKNKNERQKEWNIFTNNKTPDDITLYYRSKGTKINQPQESTIK